MKNLNILFLLFLITVFFVGLYLYAYNLLFNKKCNAEPFQNEGDTEMMDSSSNFCPNLLINKGNILLLYNTLKPEIKGINPIPFLNLDEYIQYLEIQRKNGINCPILYLQRENDAQGNDVYRVRPSPFDQQGGAQLTRAQMNVPPRKCGNRVVSQPTINPATQLTRSQFNHMDNNYSQTPKLLMSTNPKSDPQSPKKFIDSNRDNPPYNSGNYPGFDPTDQFIGIYTDIDAIHDSTKNAEVSDNPMDINWGGVMHTEQSVQSGKYDENNIVKPTYTNTNNVVSYPNSIPHPAGIPSTNYR